MSLPRPRPSLPPPDRSRSRKLSRNRSLPSLGFGRGPPRFRQLSERSRRDPLSCLSCLSESRRSKPRFSGSRRSNPLLLPLCFGDAGPARGVSKDRSNTLAGANVSAMLCAATQLTGCPSFSTSFGLLGFLLSNGSKVVSSTFLSKHTRGFVEALTCRVQRSCSLVSLCMLVSFSSIRGNSWCTFACNTRHGGIRGSVELRDHETTKFRPHLPFLGVRVLLGPRRVHPTHCDARFWRTKQGQVHNLVLLKCALWKPANWMFRRRHSIIVAAPEPPPCVAVFQSKVR